MRTTESVTTPTTRARDRETELGMLLEAAAQHLRDQGHPDAETILLGADTRAMLDAADAVIETVAAINAVRA